MKIKTEDPGTNGVKKSVKAYIKRNPEFKKAILLYGAVMEAQQKALKEIKCSDEMGPDEIERKLSDGKPLLEGHPIEVDSRELRGLVSTIEGVIDAERKDGAGLSARLSSWSGLEPENIDDTRARVVSGKTLDLDGEWSEKDMQIALNILWEAFSPFYRKYGSILEANLDHSLWQRGFCPICGGRPLMGKFRGDDGLWLLECSLCHSLWNVKRASCPFCSSGSEGSLNYLYLDGNSTYRAQYCDNCKFYVKTVDLRESEGVSLLPLEDIITMDLDLAATEEGLKPASGYLGFNG